MKTKRFIVAVILMCIILALCSFSTWNLYTGLQELNQSIMTLKDIPSGKQQLLVERSNALLEQWNKAEDKFVLYVNHDTLDHITQIIAELPELAAHAEYSHFYSKLDAIHSLLDDLWDASVPSYRTLL